MRVTIAYNAVQEIISTDIVDYTISLSSTPLNSNDSSGTVGDFSVTFHRPYDPSNHINSRGVEILEGKGIQFTSEFGTIYGLINTVTETDHHTISVQCTSYAGGLNAYNVQARPQRGGSVRWIGPPGDSESEWIKDSGETIVNLIPNPSFEYGTDNWGQNQTSLTTSTNSWGVVEGDRCLLVNDGVNFTNQYFGTSLSSRVGQGYIFPGDFLAVSFFMRRGADQPVTTRFRISWRDDNNDEISNWQTGFEPLNATRSSVDPNNHYSYVAGPAPEGTSHVRLLWWIYDGDGSSWSEQTPWTVHLDAVIATSASTEEKALEKVSEYFDGDTSPETGSLLKNTLAYYFSLGTSTVNVSVHPDIADRKVIYPGWSGELWYHLKLLCAAEDIQLQLTGQGVVYVEPIRETEVSPYFRSSSETSVDSSSLAQKVSVREYNCEAWDRALFYPRGGWSEDTEILSVNAGEYTEQTIELAGSMESFLTPIMQTFVSKDHITSSVYTVVAEDGFPIQPQQWEDAGGNISFELGEDYQTMTVKMQGARGIRLSDGELATSFSLALSADSGGSSRYSTLRIVGNGIFHDNEKTLIVNTGIPESVTGTDVGATIDNPFLFDRERVATAASRAARQFSGAVLSARGDATNLGSGFGAEDVGGLIKIKGRPYRVREVSYSPGGLNFTADDDLTHQDMQSALQGKTYAQVQSENAGLTYRNVFARGTRY